MQFRHSAVVQVEHDRIVERADRLPTDIHPALLGSGEIALAMDATGLQGLNAWITQMADTQSIMHPDHSTNWNLYIHRDQALSQHHNQRGQDGFRLMPCGWIDYVLTVDGAAYDAPALAKQARLWERTFAPKTGMLETAFDIAGVRLTVRAGIAPDAVTVDIAFAARSLDGQPRQVAITLRVHQTLRDGRPLATGGMETLADETLIQRAWAAGDATSTARLLEPIAMRWSIGADSPARFETAATVITAMCTGDDAAFAAGFRVVCGSDRDGTDGPAYARERIAALHPGGIETGLAEIAAAWEAYFDHGAEIWIGEPDKEFLLLQAQYVLRAGESFHAGIVLGTHWAETFGGATFFDSLSVCEGMLRCGHIPQVRAFCQWLTTVSPETGRPFYHMTYYNGQPAGRGEDAFQVAMAYGSTVIRLYEFTRDDADLRGCVEPYLRRLCRYLLDEKLVFDGDQWRLRGAYSADGHLPPEDLAEHRGLLFWFAVLLSTYADYADRLGLAGEPADRCRAFRDWVRAQGVLRRDDGGDWWSDWLPYILNRTPYVDLASFKPHFVGLFPEGGRAPVGYQPWNSLSTATSALLCGAPDEAQALADDAFLGVCGLGYFSESWYEMRGGGFAPYPPASGAYLAYMLNTLVDGGNDGDAIRIGTDLSRRGAHHRLRWRNARTVNGATISGTYTPYGLELDIDTPRPRRAVIAVPARMAGEPVRVVINGAATTVNDLAPTLALDLPAGRTAVVVERDLQTPCDALVVEPMAHGREIAALLREAGLSVRWLRDLPTLAAVIDQPRVLFLHTSYASMPVEVAALAERAVRRGATLITLFHSGRIDVDTALAELTGVRARQPSPHWDYDTTPHPYALTELGRRVLPGLPPEFNVPQVGEFVPDLLPDTETLAIDRATGRTVVTRRRVGEGWACWIAAGNKSADGPQYAYTQSTNEMHNHGMDYEARQERHWLHDANWRHLFQALACTTAIRASRWD